MKAIDRKRIDAFEIWCWSRLLKIPSAKRTNVSIHKELKLERTKPLSYICMHRILLGVPTNMSRVETRTTYNISKIVLPDPTLRSPVS